MSAPHTGSTATSIDIPAARQLDRLCELGHAHRCLQCHKCTAGCPLASEMDLQPSQIVRMLQLGQLLPLLESKAIWICTSCHACTDRCPAGVDLCHVQDSLRRECRQTGTQPADLRSAVAADAMLLSVAESGRMNELAVMRRFKLQTKTLFERFFLGVALFFRGKLKLFQNRSGSRREIRALVRRFLPRGHRRKD